VGIDLGLQVAPYNTFYPRLEAHLAQVGIDATVNRWDRILTLGVVDHNEPFVHPNGVADVQAEGATVLQPEKFTIFTVCICSDCIHYIVE
jgi:TBCC domain-containing protein 1